MDSNQHIQGEKKNKKKKNIIINRYHILAK